MAVSKQMLMDWLGEIPEDAKFGIEIGPLGHRNLVAFYDNEPQDILAVGDMPSEGGKTNPASNGHG